MQVMSVIIMSNNVVKARRGNGPFRRPRQMVPVRAFSARVAIIGT